MSRLDSRSVQRLIREIDPITLVTAISGASGRIQARLLQQVSKKRAIVLIDQMNSGAPAMIADIAGAQKLVIEIMNSLRNQGDIVI